MKKLLTILFVFVLFLWAMPSYAQEKINLYFFYGDGCPHCAKEEVFLDQLEKENKNINVYRYETWNNRENAQLLVKIAKKMDVNVSGVPFLIIGDRTVVGFYDAETTGKKIKAIIDNYDIYGCRDVVAPILQNEHNDCEHGCDEKDEECLHNCGCSSDTESNTSSEIPETLNLPLLGSVETKALSLPVLTFLVAAIDGFNPCAMWVLLFLINLLLGMKDRKKMFILGTAFIVSSGVVYFLFLSAWLNLLLFLGFVLWLRIAIGLVALGSGIFHIKDWYDNRDGGCKVINTDKRKAVFSRLREIVSAKSFIVSLLGIILLAGAVNLVELVCSAGLPAVYTQILALSNLPAWEHYFYLFLYVVIFMLDDMAVFYIAMKTLEMKASDNVIARYSGIVGGVIMVILGLLLIFKPGWVMFG
jgi:glutaredoxin